MVDTDEWSRLLDDLALGEHERGCGMRELGGVYVEVPFMEVARPDDRMLTIEQFVVCPPLAVDPESLGMSARGVTLLERNDGSGVVDVWDWVGGDAYPNVLDMLVEVNRLGLSRRIARTAAFDRLDERSFIVLVHGRGIIANCDQYRAAIHKERMEYPERLAAPARSWYSRCPQRLGLHSSLVNPFTPNHAWNDQMCAALWAEDVTGGSPVLDPDQAVRTVLRTLPSFGYRARSRPEGIKPQYRPAVIARFPIARLAVIDDPERPELTAETFGFAQRGRLPVRLERS